MNRKQKLIEILKDSPESLSLSQIITIIESIGFTLQKKTKGSHLKYRYKDITIILSPHNGEIKNYQKKQIRDKFFPLL